MEVVQGETNTVQEIIECSDSTKKSRDHIQKIIRITTRQKQKIKVKNFGNLLELCKPQSFQTGYNVSTTSSGCISNCHPLSDINPGLSIQLSEGQGPSVENGTMLTYNGPVVTFPIGTNSSGEGICSSQSTNNHAASSHDRTLQATSNHTTRNPDQTLQTNNYTTSNPDQTLETMTNNLRDNPTETSLISSPMPIVPRSLRSSLSSKFQNCYCCCLSYWWLWVILLHLILLYYLLWTHLFPTGLFRRNTYIKDDDNVNNFARQNQPSQEYGGYGSRENDHYPDAIRGNSYSPLNNYDPNGQLSPGDNYHQTHGDEGNQPMYNSPPWTSPQQQNNWNEPQSEYGNNYPQILNSDQGQINSMYRGQGEQCGVSCNQRHY